MPDFDSPAIANEFARLNGGFMPQMKMHKLSYIAHGWAWAIIDKPLIREQPQAWDNGPVYRRIWDRIRDYGLDDRGRIVRPNGIAYVADLSAEEHQLIDHVWNRYKAYDQYKLSAMTHQPGTPWSDVYFNQGRNEPIPNDLIVAHYRDLARAGRRHQQQRG